MKLNRITSLESASNLEIEKDVIKGALVITAGDAKGHGFSVDDQFIQDVKDSINEKPRGLKARFGHPNMCDSAVGSYLGRWKNASLATVLRDNGTEAFAVRADLHISKSAKKSPKGDLCEYVKELAKADGDMFGTSIVFEHSKQFIKDEEGNNIYEFEESEGQTIFIELDKLRACDIVDEPAANDSMFSEFSQATIAADITYFLDNNQEVFKALCENKEVLEALKKYPQEISLFLDRYSVNKKGQEMTEEKEKNAETLDKEVKEEALEETEETVSLSKEEFLTIKEKFGSEIAADVFAKDGNYTDGLQIAFDQQLEQIESLKMENFKLSEQIEHLTSLPSGSAADETEKNTKTLKKVYNTEDK